MSALHRKKIETGGHFRILAFMALCSIIPQGTQEWLAAWQRFVDLQRGLKWLIKAELRKVRYAQSYATKSWRWEPNFVVANLYKDQVRKKGGEEVKIRFRMKPTGTVRSAEGFAVSFFVYLWPFCHCGRKADLKPVLKEASQHRGRYFWSCRNPRVKKGVYRTCDFFKWDDELIKDGRTI
ncbi:hypothetical protein AK812_SmicGene4265 [Symbiodinium microadriaticum]|uniref:GRF-type domain-containing protein n=1 Tax=Symbiodinium microadriaticum TaxID=2951 RepID=A0A1Q9EWU6_SYMMI|nr:hypothetical protein AK812_SmicGene4265 [Symbiodinium microadriaticum]